MDQVLDYNILVTYHTKDPQHGIDEAMERLRDIGIEVEDKMKSSVPGLLLVRVAGNPKEAIRRLKEFALKFPEVFQYTHRWVPIERWVAPEEKAMIRAAKELGAGIKDEDRWKLDLKSRSILKCPSRELVCMLTDPIDRGTVDLDDPDKILVVEMVSDAAGFSLVGKDEFFDINQIRERIGMAKIP